MSQLSGHFLFTTEEQLKNWSSRSGLVYIIQKNYQPNKMCIIFS